MEAHKRRSERWFPVSWEKRRNSTLADIGLLRHSEPPKQDTEIKPPPPEKPQSREPSPRLCEPIREDTKRILSRNRTFRVRNEVITIFGYRRRRITIISTTKRINIRQVRACKVPKSRKSIKMALEFKEDEVEKLKLERDFERKKKDLQELRSKLEMLQNRNHFLNDEIQKLSRMLQQEQFRNHSKQL
ncbi:TBC1 domain family member 2B [Caerostris extrusa]|uniref:TBC1 domain family member 2B n=1 Tax=Caerostris extrusa TaxID=172846 RepID=A0AAV4QM51_CAEEX|nr:TBC1 domain family member 2B [Caerostris extrusa]